MTSNRIPSSTRHHLHIFNITIPSNSPVIVFKDVHKKRKQRHAICAHNWFYRNMSLAFKWKPVIIFMYMSRSKTEVLNPFSYFNGKQYAQPVNSARKCFQNATNVLYWTWQPVLFHVRVNESYYQTKTPNWSVQLFFLLCVSCSFILTFKYFLFWFS